MRKYEKGKACGTYEEKREIYSVLVGKPEGRRQLGNPRRTCNNNNNNNNNLREIVLVVFTVINVAQDRPCSWLF